MKQWPCPSSHFCKSYTTWLGNKEWHAETYHINNSSSFRRKKITYLFSLYLKSRETKRERWKRFSTHWPIPNALASQGRVRLKPENQSSIGISHMDGRELRTCVSNPLLSPSGLVGSQTGNGVAGTWSGTLIGDVAPQTEAWMLYSIPIHDCQSLMFSQFSCLWTNRSKMTMLGFVTCTISKEMYKMTEVFTFLFVIFGYLLDYIWINITLPNYICKYTF